MHKIEYLRHALQQTPEDPGAHNALGIAMFEENAVAEAENHFRGALRLHPDHPAATMNLGAARQALGYVEEAEALYRRAVLLGIDPAQASNNLAVALTVLGRLPEAEQACREALAARPDFAEAEVNLAMTLLKRGQMEAGWRHYEARWRVAPLRHEQRPAELYRWTGAEPLMGKTILLHAEQGFGDTIQFCRYAPLLADRGARVILAVPQALRRLLGSLRGIDTLIGPDDRLPSFDWHCPLMSLPLALGTIDAPVPYLAAEPRSWTGRGTSRRIGLVWAGGQRPDQPLASAIDRRRSMRLADMAGFGEVPGCIFVSLQHGPPADHPPFPLIDVTDQLTDFADTASLIQSLDLVISVDTAVAHLAGALGKPVWLLSRFDACWRWMEDREDTPWYPTMRLFRQASPGDWAGVIGHAAQKLREFAATG